MSMQLTVLGGAAAWPNPGQGCSSYLVTASHCKLLLDCGPDTLLELRKHTPLGAIDAVVISHCHSDHILDLVTFRYALVYSKDRASTRIPLWLPPGGEEILQALGSALGSQGETTVDFWGDVFEIREYDAESTLGFGDLSVDFARTQHFTPCYAIRVKLSSGKTIVYGADMGEIDSLVEFSTGASLLVAEATADSNEGIELDQRGHITPEDAGDWAARSSVDRLVICHLWSERDPAEVVRRAATHFDRPIDVATPGFTDLCLTPGIASDMLPTRKQGPAARS